MPTQLSHPHWQKGIRERALTLVQTHKWDDPFENFLLRSTGVKPDGSEVSLKSLHDKWYGQCWTTLEESDAMWRIYAPDQDGVRVRSSVGKLFDAICNRSDPTAQLCCFVGAVTYVDEADIAAFMSNPTAANATLFSQSGSGHASTLLVKRREFEHEHEVRVLFAANSSTVFPCGDTVSFPIDPNLLFEEAVLDPRLDDACAPTLENQLWTAGLAVPIRKSTLYRVPQFRFPIIV
jgi:hypothetical protein